MNLATEVRIPKHPPSNAEDRNGLMMRNRRSQEQFEIGFVIGSGLAQKLQRSA